MCKTQYAKTVLGSRVQSMLSDCRAKPSLACLSFSARQLVLDVLGSDVANKFLEGGRAHTTPNVLACSHTKCPISWIAIEPFQICRKYRRPLRSALSCDISWKLTLPVPKRTPGPQEQPSSSSTSDPPKRCATSVKICNLVNLIGHYKVQSTDSVVTNM